MKNRNLYSDTNVLAYLYTQYKIKRSAGICSTVENFIDQEVELALNTIKIHPLTKPHMDILLGFLIIYRNQIIQHLNKTDESLPDILKKIYTDYDVYIQRVSKKIENENLCCCFKGCNKKAISSHLIQKEGIISKIAPNRHVYQNMDDPFNNNLTPFKKRGINIAFTFKGFCNEHDTSLFKKIETDVEDVDFNDYKNQLLFTYRAVMKGKREKENTKKKWSILLTDNPLLRLEYLHERIDQIDLSIQDVTYYEDILLNNLSSESRDFIFFTRFTNFNEVCLSSISTYDTAEELLNYQQMWGIQKERTCNFIINYFPISLDKNILIIGYLKSDERYCGEWINNIIDSEENKLWEYLSLIMLRMTENWIISESIYEQNIVPNEDKIFSIFKECALHMNERSPVSINLFS